MNDRKYNLINILYKRYKCHKSGGGNIKQIILKARRNFFYNLDSIGGNFLQPGKIGELLGNCFPATVRVNRHHRRRFIVDSKPSLWPQVDGEYSFSFMARPAKINLMNRK